ncbi:hypothetical protein H7J87_29675 [Mycolicibacterium wolinskyi]|uniref:hypothetical protein n=1 Tax=Mycolicibacterium TaxID=1866885 RepID=UPI001A98E0A1|nr:MULTISPECIES: hypothetical protein [Mycolicibacterium]MCV7289501.1 hypothetical protein [Mycolicibacterium wolinskyi]MCV7297495.1 hypothetical protein [Mycolicibacterium goodii]
MNTMGEPRIVAETGGLVVAEDGPNVVVVDRGNGPSEIFAFVLLIFTLVCGGFGVVSMIMAAAGSLAVSSVVVGAVLLGVGLLAGVGLAATARALRRRRLAPLHTFTPVAVFDRAQRVYRDGAGQIIAPLDQVRFERHMQLTSSSPKLVAVTPVGVRVLKRGNPFGGGVGNLDEVLTAVVHGR